MSDAQEVYGVVIPDEHSEIVRAAFDLSGYPMSSEGIIRFVVDGCIEMMEGDGEDEEIPRGASSKEKSDLAERLNEYIKNNPDQVRYAMNAAGHIGPVIAGLWKSRVGGKGKG